MDIIGLGKPRADSCLRKFRIRGGVALVKTLLYKGALFFWKRHKTISWHHTNRWKNFGVQHGLTNKEDDI
jgi:hypothetical protein